MALKKQGMVRVFKYSGVDLPDPDPTMTLTEVRDFFANTGRSELTSAEVRGPEVVGTTQVFTLHRVTGTTGGVAACNPMRREARKDVLASTAALLRLSKKIGVTAIDERDGATLTRLTMNRGDSPCYLPSAVTPWIG